jgi:hypothetical protein
MVWICCILFLQASLKLASSNDCKALVLFNFLLCYVISSRLQLLVSLEIRCLVKFFHTPFTIFLNIWASPSNLPLAICTDILPLYTFQLTDYFPLIHPLRAQIIPLACCALTEYQWMRPSVSRTRA